MRRLKFGLVGRGGGDAGLRISVQSISRVEGDWHGATSLPDCLPDHFRSGCSKGVIGNSERVGTTQIREKPLMKFFPGRIRQRRFRFVVNSQNLLSYGVGPASEKARFRWRGPAS